MYYCLIRVRMYILIDVKVFLIGESGKYSPNEYLISLRVTLLEMFLNFIKFQVTQFELNSMTLY